MKKELKTLEEIRIYSDPYRIQIMSEFQKIGRPATVKEVADSMNEVPAKVHYHVKKLESIGLVSLVDTKLINGITAKYYEPFDGEISIRKSEFDEALHPVFQSETQKLLNNIFEEGKKRFLLANQHPEPNGTLMNQSVYLTKEEAKELVELIKDYCNRHQTDDKSVPREKFDILFAIAKSPEPEQDGINKKEPSSP
ncbi:helix-turn-helix domain-containing protein [Paenibacillus sp. M1]|uniref:Helix-turn-helix domain-containing protein n=1 Tax=Paenibacillus haidiansis TaxID=1574488 RepID=A0ABU7VTS8_9BACL